MAGTKKPRKAYRPNWNSGGVLLKAQPWKVKAVFGPLETMQMTAEYAKQLIKDFKIKEELERIAA